MNEAHVTRHLDLIAERFDAEMEQVCEDVDRAIIRAIPRGGADPVIRNEIRSSTQSNVRRVVLAIRTHAEIVPPRVPTEATDLIAGLVRRGIGREAISEAYRLGQQVMWRRWVALAGEVVDRPEDLADVLTVSLDAMFRYIDQVVAAVSDAFDQESEAMAGSGSARRAETVRLLLAGAPIGEDQARRRLGYDLARHNTAFVVWSETEEARPGVLAATARALAATASAGVPLVIEAGHHLHWGWLSTSRPLDFPAVADFVPADERVRVAVGPSLAGLEGFSTSHQRATALHQLVAHSRFGAPVVLQQDVEVASLVGSDPRRAAEFIAGTLGALAAHEPTAERLRETLRIFLEESGNAPRAAERLHTHRNTVLKRVARAEEILGHDVRTRRLAVELALELQRWLPADASPRSDSAR